MINATVFTAGPNELSHRRSLKMIARIFAVKLFIDDPKAG